MNDVRTLILNFRIWSGKMIWIHDLIWLAWNSCNASFVHERSSARVLSIHSVSSAEISQTNKKHYESFIELWIRINFCCEVINNRTIEWWILNRTKKELIQKPSNACVFNVNCFNSIWPFPKQLITKSGPNLNYDPNRDHSSTPIYHQHD